MKLLRVSGTKTVTQVGLDSSRQGLNPSSVIYCLDIKQISETFLF